MATATTDTDIHFARLSLTLVYFVTDTNKTVSLTHDTVSLTKIYVYCHYVTDNLFLSLTSFHCCIGNGMATATTDTDRNIA